jgi:hypothetical protein
MQYRVKPNSDNSSPAELDSVDARNLELERQERRRELWYKRRKNVEALQAIDRQQLVDNIRKLAVYNEKEDREASNYEKGRLASYSFRETYGRDINSYIGIVQEQYADIDDSKIQTAFDIYYALHGRAHSFELEYLNYRGKGDTFAD